MMMKRITVVGLVVFLLVGAMVTGVMAARGGASPIGSDPSPGAPVDSLVGVLSPGVAALEAGGFGAVDFSIADKTATIKAEVVSVPTDHLEKGLQADLPYLVAARAGATDLKLNVQLPNGRVYENERSIWVNVVPRTDAAKAKQATEDWLASVAKRTGATLTATFDASEYRLDAVVSGSRSQVLAASEALFSDGGYYLNKAGQLELFTVNASFDGSLAFVGFRDWVDMSRTICFKAKDFDLEY